MGDRPGINELKDAIIQHAENNNDTLMNSANDAPHLQPRRQSANVETPYDQKC